MYTVLRNYSLVLLKRFHLIFFFSYFTNRNKILRIVYESERYSNTKFASTVDAATSSEIRFSMKFCETDHRERLQLCSALAYNCCMAQPRGEHFFYTFFFQEQ